MVVPRNYLHNDVTKLDQSIGELLCCQLRRVERRDGYLSQRLRADKGDVVGEHDVRLHVPRGR